VPSKAESEKFEQYEVHYEKKSTHPFRRCGNCAMFVEPNRVALVHLTYARTSPERVPWPIAAFVLDRIQLEEQWALRN